MLRESNPGEQAQQAEEALSIAPRPLGDYGSLKQVQL